MMNTLVFRPLFFGLFTLFNFSMSSVAAAIAPFSLPLDLSGAEYDHLLNDSNLKNQSFETNIFSSNDDNTINTILNVGKRNLDWLNYINKSLPAANRLSFTSAETQIAFPMDHISKYNASIIASEYLKLIQDLPNEIKSVVIDGESFTSTPPLETNDYLNWGRLIDRSYQMAARWTIMKPYLSFLADSHFDDIRGFYYLSTNPHREVLLKNYNQQDKSTQDQIKAWLIQICNNDRRSDNLCKYEVQSAITQGSDLNTIYNVHFLKSKKIYDNYFNIPTSAKRKDLKWPKNDSTNQLIVPFKKVNNIALEDFLRTNIEEEWQFNNWNLKLNFENNAEISIVFEPGATPHVNGLGGNSIVMDANSPLEEYNVQWAIRHEFGHVLGFPDCYLEFYDEDEKAIIGYQIDITDLMCSRRGHIKERHYNELARVYQ